jgi:hypothetical protein
VTAVCPPRTLQGYGATRRLVSGLVAVRVKERQDVQAADPVVARDQRQYCVVLAAANIGPFPGRSEIYNNRP